MFNFFKKRQKTNKVFSGWILQNGKATPIKSVGNPHTDWFFGVQDYGLDDFLNPTPEGLANAYQMSSVANRCTNLRANTISSVPLVLKRKTDKGIVDVKNHPLNDIFSDKKSRLIRITEIDLCVQGVSYWGFVKDFYGRIVDFKRINPLSMRYEADKTGLQLFYQELNGQRYQEWSPDEIIFFSKGDDPKNDFNSISPMQIALKDIVIELSSSMYIDKFFKNDATPATLITPKTPLTTTELDRVVHWWEKEFRGVDNSHTAGFTPIELEVKQLATNFHDMVIPDLDARTFYNIARSFGVPPTMAITDTRSYYATGENEYSSFYTDTVIPELDFISDVINKQIVPLFEDDLFIEPDYSNVKALSDDETALSTRSVTSFTSGLITLNESREMIGFESIEGGDFYLISGKPVTKEDLESGNLPTQETQQPFSFLQNAQKAINQSAFSDLEKWKKKVLAKGRKVSFESEFIPSAISSFVRMDLKCNRDINDTFNSAKAHLKKQDDLATPEEFIQFWQSVDENFDELGKLFFEHLENSKQRLINMLENNSFDSAEFFNNLENTDELQKQLVGSEDDLGVLSKIILGGAVRGNELANNHKQVNIAWDLISQNAVRWASLFTNNLITQINQTTATNIQNYVSKWIEDGKPLPDLAKDIQSELEKTGKLGWSVSSERALMIAQTETTRAFQEGVQQRWKQLGIKRMIWRTANDTRVCQNCRDLNNKIGDMETGWSGKKPPLHPNCRCFTRSLLN